MELGGSCDHSEWSSLLFAMPPEYRRWGTHSSRRGKRKLRSAYLRLSQAQRSCAGQTPSISSISKANLYGSVSSNRHPKRGPEFSARTPVRSAENERGRALKPSAAAADAGANLHLTHRSSFIQRGAGPHGRVRRRRRPLTCGTKGVRSSVFAPESLQAVRVDNVMLRG